MSVGDVGGKALDFWRRRSKLGKAGIIIGAVVLVAVLTPKGSDSPSPSPTTTTQAVAAVVNTTKAQTTTTVATTTTTTPTTTTAPTTTTTTGPQFTQSEIQAIRKAQAYLDYTAFSRTKLIEQLEYEGFSKADSTAAVDALDVDWNEQAALKAADYLDYSGFSRRGLIDQLQFEGFTAEQATYGADQVGL